MTNDVVVEQHDLVQQLRGRARYLRHRGEVKSPELLERAADRIEALAAREVGEPDISVAESILRNAEAKGRRTLPPSARAVALLAILAALGPAIPADETEKTADENCPGCRGGDKVPPGEYFLCPVCDTEWPEEAA